MNAASPKGEGIQTLQKDNNLGNAGGAKSASGLGRLVKGQLCTTFNSTSGRSFIIHN